MIWPFNSARAEYLRGIEDAANHAAVYATKLNIRSRQATRSLEELVLWRASLEVEALAEEIRRLKP